MNMIGQRERPWQERITPNAGQPPTQPSSPWMPSNVRPDYNAAPNARVYAPEIVQERMMNPPTHQSERQKSDTEGMGNLSELFGGPRAPSLADMLQNRDFMPYLQPQAPATNLYPF